MPLNLIYARARNGVIGRDNALPWHLPEDLAHFKRHTLGGAVLMGRKTWESLPERFRPLPGRRNLVLTAQTHWQAAGANPVHSLAQALAQVADASPLWVIGGAQLYALAEPLATQAIVTEIDADFEGDAFAPTLGSAWHEVSRQTQVSVTGLRYAFVVYQRISGV
jgi:dihydrofolate reductase